MSGTGGWARMTPYELGIPGREFADRAFAGIRDEAVVRGFDLTDPGAFILLGEVGRAIRGIQGEERGGDVLHRFAAFLFQAFHFHERGEPLYLLEEEAARRIAEGSFDSSSWAGELPSDAGYLQLPRNLFWSEPDAGEHAEPLDGVSWVRSSGDTLSLLVALGVRKDRAGLSLTELPPVSLGEMGAWLTEPMRAEGGDFSSKLPGGELGGLYTVSNMGEVLKLLARCFTHLAESPQALGPFERGPHPRDIDRGTESVGPSLLRFRRIGLVGERRTDLLGETSP